jgi:thiamine biosynthesis lipoprotein
MKLVGMDKVNILGGYVVKANPAMFLDVNAIAQGYSVDVVCKCFDSLKINTYLVEIGGEVRVKGKKGREYWKIGIDKPEDYNFTPGNNLEAIVKLENKSVSTSGNYRKFYVENGIKYSHTIDPKTGEPVRHQLLSASIFADDCTTADAFATACMVVGKEGAINFINKYKFLEGYLIYSDENGNFKTWMSEDLRKIISEE